MSKKEMTTEKRLKVRLYLSLLVYTVVGSVSYTHLDNVNQDKLMKLVEQRISDRRILKLIRQWLVSGVLYGNVLTISELGTSQGSLCRAPHNEPYDEINVMTR